ncbi:DoxX family protein [Microvirga sp. KLBC 81]|uniref:DoxX family protein n=1 Tax=Microvirga sp. KLBC 81 TaxID=1862707 RepID=UPI000D519C9F|nr:DoxX family protein [Microvirga sp. KLBC 81]PVE23464.1 DoxX family protein [Microvirga sp. KLBC 81]
MLTRSEDAALLVGRVLIAALFLPSGYSKLMAFSAFSASLAAKGLPYPTVIAGVLVAAEFLGPLALVIGLWPRWTASALIGFVAATLWMTYGPFATGLILRPRQNVEFFQNLALIGGLLFYFASGPGGWSRTRLR